MTYQNIKDLPQGVRNSLPVNAQVVYKEVFNTTLQQYDDSSEHDESEDAESVAHKVAWGAVKQSYEKVGDGNWRKKI